jgi:hypothetical protein
MPSSSEANTMYEILMAESTELNQKKGRTRGMILGVVFTSAAAMYGFLEVEDGAIKRQRAADGERAIAAMETRVKEEYRQQNPKEKISSLELLSADSPACNDFKKGFVIVSQPKKAEANRLVIHETIACASPDKATRFRTP